MDAEADSEYLLSTKSNAILLFSYAGPQIKKFDYFTGILAILGLATPNWHNQVQTTTLTNRQSIRAHHGIWAACAQIGMDVFDCGAHSETPGTRERISRGVRKPVFGVPTRSDTNLAVQSQKMIRGLKFRI